MSDEPSDLQVEAFKRAVLALRGIARAMYPANPEFLTNSPPIHILTQLYCAKLQALASYGTAKQLNDIAGQLATISKRLQNRD